MWIMMNDAFLSIVEDKDDEHTLMVRARVEGDIEKVFPDALVLEWEGTDYAYRAFMSREVVAKAMSREIYRIDYDNFKNSVVDNNRHKVYTQVWIDCLDLQPYNIYNDPAYWESIYGELDEEFQGDS